MILSVCLWECQPLIYDVPDPDCVLIPLLNKLIHVTCHRELSRWKFPLGAFLKNVSAVQQRAPVSGATFDECWSSIVLIIALENTCCPPFCGADTAFWLCRAPLLFSLDHDSQTGGLRERGSDLSNEIETKWILWQSPGDATT